MPGPARRSHGRPEGRPQGRAPGRARATATAHQRSGARRASPRLAVVALLLALPLLGAALPAQAQTVHEDYPRAGRDEDAIRLAAQAVVDACLVSARDLLRQDVQAAHAQANASLRLGGRMQAAASEPRGTVERPEVLYSVAPLADNLGQGMPAVVAQAASLYEPGIGRSAFLHARGQLEAEVEQMVANATALASHGVQTQELVDALRQLLEVVRRLDVPAGDAPLAQATAQGPGWSLLLAPDPAWFGQRVTASLAGPASPGTFRLTLFGKEMAAPFDQGYARLAITVPWTVEAGEHAWRAEWEGQSASGQLTVVRVPTALVDAAHGRDASNVTVTARLRDADQRAVQPATLSWQAWNGPVAIASGTAATGLDGRLRVELPAAATSATFAYAGNRTHAPARLELDLAAARPDPFIQPLPPAATTRPALADQVPWLLILLAALAVLLAAVAAQRIRRARRMRAEAMQDAGVLFLTRSPPVAAALPADHPLLLVLAKAGHDVRPMTMREAASLWVRLGAPAVWDYVRLHELTYYRGQPPAKVPQELMRWAQAQA